MATLSIRDIDSVRQTASVVADDECSGNILAKCAKGLAFWWKYAMTPGFGLFAEFYLMLLFNQLPSSNLLPSPPSQFPLPLHPSLSLPPFPLYLLLNLSLPLSLSLHLHLSRLPLPLNLLPLPLSL